MGRAHGGETKKVPRKGSNGAEQPGHPKPPHLGVIGKQAKGSKEHLKKKPDESQENASGLESAWC